MLFLHKMCKVNPFVCRSACCISEYVDLFRYNFVSDIDSKCCRADLILARYTCY